METFQGCERLSLVPEVIASLTAERMGVPEGVTALPAVRGSPEREPRYESTSPTSPPVLVLPLVELVVVPALYPVVKAETMASAND